MSSDRSVSLHVPRSAIWLFALLLIAPWVALGTWAYLHSTASRRPRPIRPVITVGSDLTRCQPGPWGDLAYYRILIEPPEEFIPADIKFLAPPPWLFKGYTTATLAALWQSAGLDAGQLKFANDPAHAEIRPDGIVFHPGRAFIIGLSPAARGHVYTALGAFTENFAQFNPYRLRSTLADNWLDHAGIPPQALALTKRLLYHRGTATCFSDEAVVLPTISSPADRVKYIKALSRKSALVVELIVHPNEDVDRLVDYWGRGGRSKDLKPLLQSLARRPDGGAIDIVHLVPRFARMLAYTYPLPSDRPADANHDCHWTSFNFQNDQPDERFSDINYVRKVLLEQYYPVAGEPLLGDVILFVRPDGVVLHSCVYIADDIVFTKNGPAPSIPWVFSPLADVQAFYAEDPGIQMRRYRARDL